MNASTTTLSCAFALFLTVFSGAPALAMTPRQKAEAVKVVLEDHKTQVTPIYAQLETATQAYVQACSEVLTEEQQELLFEILPAELQAAAEDSLARIAALPPQERTAEAIQAIVYEEVSEALATVVGELNLTPAQVYQLTLITMDYTREVEPLFAELAVIRAETKAEIEEILNS